MTLGPDQVHYEKHCLIYCGDQFCDCRRGPRNRPRGPLSEHPLPDILSSVTSAPRAPVPSDNFHHRWDYADNLPEDGSPRDLYVLMYNPATGLHQVSPTARSLMHAAIIDDGFGRLVGGHTVVQHKLRVRRRWLPIHLLEAGYVARLGCDRYPDTRLIGHSRSDGAGGVIVETYNERPRDWYATHFDRASLRPYTVTKRTAPHGAQNRVPRSSPLLAAPYGRDTSERRVPRLPAPRPVRSPED